MKKAIVTIFAATMILNIANAFALDSVTAKDIPALATGNDDAVTHYMTSEELDAYNKSEVPPDGWRKLMERLEKENPNLLSAVLSINRDSVVVEETAASGPVETDRNSGSGASFSDFHLGLPRDVIPAINGTLDVVNGALDVVDKITNMGGKVMTYVFTNRGLVEASVKNFSASAVPVGVPWTELEGAADHVAKSYAITMKNKFGMTVVKAKYTISGAPCVQYRGKGEYLQNVSVGLEASVAWYHKLTMTCEIPDEGIMNVGTVEDPIASMKVGVKWTVQYPLSSVTSDRSYIIRGSGLIYNIRDRRNGRDENQGVPPEDICKSNKKYLWQRE